MKRALTRTLATLAALAAAIGASAQTTDIANAPLAQSVTDNVKPNLMFILDDSGSMGSRFLPDFINGLFIDKPRRCDSYDDGEASNRNSSGSECNQGGGPRTTTRGREGNPPWYAYQFNSVYYNPNITYLPAVNADGTQRTSFGSPWTAVRVNPFSTSDTSTINLTSQYPELVYCINSNDDPTSSTNCRRHGMTGSGQTGNPFTYNTSTVTNGSMATGLPNGTATVTGTSIFRFPRVLGTNPFYYDIVPVEHCSDEALTDCTMSGTASTSFPFPAPVRYCNAQADANSSTAVTGSVTLSSPSRTVAKCQDKYSSDHTFPRYGQFRRVDIVSSVTSYSGRPNRSDCAARPSCTYAEEMTNFANWYAYYSDRLKMMKSSAGRAFVSIDNRFRVGFITINPGSPVSSSDYLKIDTFENTASSSHRSNWYDKLYGAVAGSATPLRVALSRVGRLYAGKFDGINNGIPSSDDPVQYSCQRNVALLTTDGYWNGSAGQDVNGNAISNQDNTDSGYSTRADGAFDGNLSTTGFTSSGTLADVALYYYQTDLRTSGPVSTPNVPTSTRYTNPEQHMITFTLGLGLDGRMRYRPDYETAGSGDFWKIKNAQNTCSWGASGACNWPQIPTNPTVDSFSNVDPSKIDDLWHTAVNGRGKYVSARDADSLVEGLQGALNELKVQQGAAAASATSSPNITQTDNFIFSSSYRTVKWDGELEARKIDATTGNILPAATFSWSARSQLNAAVTSNSDGRTIYTNVSGSLVGFSYANLDATAKAFFDNRCTLLSQCTLMTVGERNQANNGANLVNYLRGQRQHEGAVFRSREYVLGDMAGSRPAFVREPRRSYGDAVTPSYASFKTSNASRAPVVYIGSNGGMLHAFNADTGAELWSFVPRAMLPQMYRLADENYGALHRYFVDGSPTIQDVYFGGSWRTVLVAGYNAGGRGFFALDVTNPASPSLLWEICSDSTLCSNAEANMGLSFGNPVITKRASDGRWVALLTSGYNNVLPGDGGGWLYVVDISNGSVLNRVGTGVGSTTSPSGLARISAWVRDPATDNTALYVYGGDLEGNVWRFDLQTSPPAVLRLATLRDASNRPQPVTTRPELGLVTGNRVVYALTGRLLGVSDLVDPATLLPAGGWSYQSSVYAIKDGGSALGNLRTSGTMINQTVSNIDAARRTTTKSTVDWSLKNGWYVDLPTTGERVNVDPQLVLGTLVFSSNIPSTDACTAGGSSWLYQMDFRTGGCVSTSSNCVTGWLRSSTLTVGNVIGQLSDGSLKNISTGADGTKEVREVNTDSSTQPPRRVGWRELRR